jgi:hypothetical protein
VIILQAAPSPPSSLSFQILEPYNTSPLDTLFTLPIDTCLNYIPDTFYVSRITVNGNVVTATWVFMGGGVITTLIVDYTFSNNGTYIIAISINCAKTTTTYMTYINITNLLGVEENAASEIRIYPNPSGEQFNLMLPSGKAYGIQVYSTMGQLIYTSNSTSETLHTIDASPWPAGMYFIRLNDDQGQIITRNIIKR